MPDYEIFGVNTVKDDVFGSGEVIESFGYRDEEGELREVFLVDYNETKGRISYEKRDFTIGGGVLGQTDIEVTASSDADEIIASLEGRNPKDALVDKEAEEKLNSGRESRSADVTRR